MEQTINVQNENEVRANNDSDIIQDIVTAAVMWKDALDEQRHVESARTRLCNIMLSNIGLITSALVKQDEYEAQLKDANELIDVLQNSLGEADDRIKALERASTKRKK